jgi:hypothetical protein
MVDELGVGPCMAVELSSACGENTVQAFRSICGPHDSVIIFDFNPVTSII